MAFIIDPKNYADERSKELLADNAAFAQRNTVDPMSICDDYEVVADALESGIPTLITGEPGTGKTSLILALANHFGIPAWLTPCNGSMSASELIGKIVFNTNEGVDGDTRKTVFMPGPLLWCYVNGGIALLDDGLQLTSAAMTAVMEFGMMPNIYNCSANGRVYHRHPNFRLVMTGNLGCVGTNKVPEALLDRFRVAVDVERLSPKAYLLIGKSKWGWLKDDFFKLAYDFSTAIMTEAQSNAKKHVPCGIRQLEGLMGILPEKIIPLNKFAIRVKTTFVSVLRKALIPTEKIDKFFSTQAAQSYITNMYNAYKTSPRPGAAASSQPVQQPSATSSAAANSGQGLLKDLLGAKL